MSEIITFAPLTASGGAEFAVPFPYLDRSHVKLYINGVEDTAKEWLSDGALKASVSVNSGDICVVKRETPRSALIRTLPTTGTLQSDDVNHQSLQAVYVATEAADGLREGLALDEATLTYWEGAPTGVNRTIKDVVDPSAAQEAATKGWYDTQLTTHASNAASSATTASTQAAAASSSATTAATQAAAATASATAAAASEATASAAASTATTAGTNATDAADEAEAWANTAEDTEVTYDNNGGINDNPSYSALHWAAKAATDAASVAADKAFAQTVSANSYPYMSSRILGDETGICANWASWTITSIDGDSHYGGGKTHHYNGDARDVIEDYRLDLVQGGELTAYRGDRYVEMGAGDMIPDVNWRTGLVGPGVNAGQGNGYYGGWATAPGNGLFGGAGTVNCVDAQGSYPRPLVNTRNPSRITASAGSPANAYIWQYVGLNGTRQIPQGYDFSACIVVPAADNQPTSNAWNDIKVEVYNDVDNLTYAAHIELDTETVASSTFSSYRKAKSWDGEWVRYDFFVPGSVAGEITYNVGTFRVYFCDATGDETGLTFAGTENYYIAYMHLHRGWHLAPLIDSTGGGTTLSTQFGIDGGGNPLTDYWPNPRPPVTFFGSYWYWGADTAAANTSSPIIMTGCDGSGSVLYIRHDPDGSVTGTSDRLYATCTDNNANSDTVDLGVNLGITDTDNGGYGTKWDFCWRVDESGFQFSYRINDGTIVHGTRTAWTGLNFAATWDPNRTFMGVSSGTQYACVTKHYDGYVCRYVEEDEAERLMTVPPLNYL